MKQRLTRLLLVIISGVIVVAGARLIVDRRQKNPQAGGLLDPIKEKLEEAGENILGEAIKNLPKAPDLDEVIEDGDAESDGEQVEPIEKPVKNVQDQTQELIEMIKDLPQDQIEAIKEQVYKEICSEHTGCGEGD